MIDTHCHLTFEQLANRLDEVLRNATLAGVDGMISVGTTPEQTRRAIAVAALHRGVYASAGLHPHYVSQYTSKSALLESLREAAASPHVVALGEMGLDRHYPEPPLAHQRQAFDWQLELAAEPALAHLPIIIHNRKATDETLAMLRQARMPGERFVFHCFAGDVAEVEAILAFGAMVSFTGIVTFPNAAEVADASDRVPVDRLMVETDAPYLTPEPYRKIRPNEPRYVVEVARFLAERRKMDYRDFEAVMDGNAKRFFRLDNHVDATG